MAEDKYAPKAEDGVDKVHALHRSLIKEQQDANKAARDKAAKKVVHADPQNPEAAKVNPTQPPASEAPQNAEAPVHQPEVK
jgi:hypothetical protein